MKIYNSGGDDGLTKLLNAMNNQIWISNNVLAVDSFIHSNFFNSTKNFIAQEVWIKSHLHVNNEQRGSKICIFHYNFFYNKN